jgi:hypothetical protein
MSNPVYQNPIKVPRKVAVPVNCEQKKDQKVVYILVTTVLLILLLLLLLFFLWRVPAGSGNSGQVNLSGNSTATISGTGEQDGTNGSHLNNGSTTSTEQAVTAIAQHDESGNGTDSETTSPNAPVDDQNNYSTNSNSPNDKFSQNSQEAATETKSIEPDQTTTGEQLLTILNDQPNKANTENFSLEQHDATLRIFGTTGKGSSFVFVFDRSGSMIGKPLYNAKLELRQALESLGKRHRFNIIFYDDGQIIWQKNLVSANPKNKFSAGEFIEGISVGGGTEPLPSLLHAISYKPDVIFFLTDGVFNINLDDVCKKAGRTKINVIHFGAGSSHSLTLQDLAERTKGDYRYINIEQLDKL